MRKSDLDTAPRLPTPHDAPIPVVCDLCRAQGEAGAGLFESLGDLLRFTPVRRRARADGWSEEYQRAFIAALAVTGSPRRAAGAIGKHEFGAVQLRRARGGASFAAAWDAAIDICRERELAGLKSGLTDLAAEQEEDRARRRELIRPRNHSSPERGGEPCAEEQMVEGSRDKELSDAEHELMVLGIYRQYLVKVLQEREARLAGRVVDADFYLRQLTFFECAMDLAQEGRHIDTWTWLANLRRDGHDLTEIAQTPFSRFLDEARRMAWDGKMEGLDQPMPTPEEYLHYFRDYMLEPPECTWGGREQTHEQQRAEQEERHRREARAQAEWEQRFADHPSSSQA